MELSELFQTVVVGEHRTLFWTTLACASFAWVYFGGSKPKGQDPTDFNSFLKKRPKNARGTAPTDFSSFLKGPSASESAAQVPEKQEKVEEVVPEDAIHVPVLYGTEYGFSKEIAETLAEKMKATNEYWPTLLDMADYPEGFELGGGQVLLVVCSTQGDGVPPTEAREFCDWLFDGKAGDLQGLNYSVCALGDSSYPHFCRCGKRIEESLEAGGGRSFATRQDIDREDWKSVDHWINDVILNLADLDLSPDVVPEVVSATGTKSGVKKWGKSNPYSAQLVTIEGLCNVASVDDKNTVLVECDLGESGLEYVPGDALGVYPQNCPEAVEEVLGVWGVDGSKTVPIPAGHYSMEQDGDEVTLEHALMECYDIRTPKAQLFTVLWNCMSPTVQKQAEAMSANNNSKTQNGTHEGQNGFSLDGAVKEAVWLKHLMENDSAREAYTEERHLADILKDFPSSNPPFDKVLGNLRTLQPRLYSISSSILEDAQKVSITVAEVMYTSLGKDRIGVASTFLARRMEVGSAVPVYISKNPDFRLPADLSTPIIMVGPGTGLAPFRAFMWERILRQQREGGELGAAVLYFGCRRRDQDYLYGDLLEAWAKNGTLQLYTAFSREQKHKVYVQHRLKETADFVWELLEKGAHFYVCGDAASMAGQVEDVLLEIIKDHWKGGDDAFQYLEELSKNGRYQRDVWF